MLLTNEDIKRIESQGFSRTDFCLPTKEANGFNQLKNVNGRCYFLNEDGKCSIYTIRPLGCQVYPLVFELSEGDVIIDEDCREVKWFAKQQYETEQLASVKELANTLLKEREKDKS